MSDNEGLEEDGAAGAANGTEDGCVIPKNSINHIVKRAFMEVGEDGSGPTRVSQEARDALAYYGMLFIRCVTDKTSQKVLQQSKKIMAPDMLLETLSDAGHEWVTRECDSTAEEGKAKKWAAKKRKLSSKLESLGIPEEELLRQQQALFQQARSEVELTNEEVDAIRESATSLSSGADVVSDGAATANGEAGGEEAQENLEEEDFDI